MASLNDIEQFLNIEIGDKTLRHGKKKQNKNRYFWYKNKYYIVQISNDKWVILPTGERIRELMHNHIWRCCNGYARNSSGYLHRMLMNPNDDMVIDHINIKTFDNRLSNLRIVTPQENNRNKSKQHNNTSGTSGVFKYKQYWVAQICDNNNKTIKKTFTINKNRTYEQAKLLAIETRLLWKEQFGYLGE